MDCQVLQPESMILKPMLECTPATAETAKPVTLWSSPLKKARFTPMGRRTTEGITQSFALRSGRTVGSLPAISWGGLKSEKKPAETGGPLLEHQLSLIHPFAFKHLFFNPLPFGRPLQFITANAESQ
nr:MAG TPA: hypothetical protein [Caudoviricetes sp.]